uniref:Uncharacterized protein LOC111101727 n=1 Tax=Crassostrea virginica TaxID=6565 RepID=A0A8B8AFR9_CRAVI|nr:uncharacterized protein LOC111101727 [Crassostrea virginica]XP_022290025.1 uncharacterized protein LOC111101727 [Crassostrea virginica]
MYVIEKIFMKHIFEKYVVLYIIVLTGVQLPCARVLAWAEGCNDSTATVEVVSHCPTTFEEQVEAAVRKSCSKYSHKCSSFVYHCVINVWENETLEVCAPRKIIVGKVCAEFNDGGKSIQRHIRRKCKTCPKVYPSNESYKYEECYSYVKRHVQRSQNSTPFQKTTIQLDTASPLSSNSNLLIPRGLAKVLILPSLAYLRKNTLF